MSTHRFPLQALFGLALAFSLALGACGGSSDSDGNGRGDGGSGAGAGTGGTGGGEGGCRSTADCESDEICNPSTRSCTAQPLSCTAHAECGNGAICVDGTCERNVTGGPCEEDANCKQGEACTGGYCGCAGQQFEAEAVPPNVMILLDKSGSMDDGGGGGRSKWEIAVDAIEELLSTYGDRIRFGLVLYPHDDECAAGQIAVDVDLGTANAIRDALAASGPNGSTPIGASLEAARSFASLKDEARQNYVLLITDGDERCRGNGEAAAAALLEQDPPVRTFVVGFGSGVDAAELNAIAEAGGTAQPGGTKYFQANDAASLEAAFAAIGGAVLSCSYELGDTSALNLTPEDIFIYFDGQPISHDPSHAGGWDYDPDTNQVTFHGDECTRLRNGEVEDLVIVHGCPVIIG